jgi:hypothetical protein
MTRTHTHTHTHTHAGFISLQKNADMKYNERIRKLNDYNSFKGLAVNIRTVIHLQKSAWLL